MSPPPTVHATVVVIGEAGVLIRGASGAGKSTLAFALIEHARQRRSFAAFVADDRVHVSAVNGRLVARVPEAIAGRAERYGRGIADTAHVPAAVVRLIVDLIAVETRPRLPEEDDTKTVIAGVTLPRQAAGCRQSEVSVPLVLATLAEINKF